MLLTLLDKSRNDFSNSSSNVEDIYEDDRIILEDANSNGNIVTEESTIRNGIVPFVQPLHYKGHPYESNNGFMYINHRVDQRVSV